LTTIKTKQKSKKYEMIALRNMKENK